MSSRSQGPESEAGDPSEQNEDTPQPSGTKPLFSFSLFGVGKEQFM